jgi:hypothetical protein
MSNRSHSGGKDGRCVGLTTLPPSCADYLEILEPQPAGTPRACPGLQRKSFTFTFTFVLHSHTASTVASYATVPRGNRLSTSLQYHALKISTIIFNIRHDMPLCIDDLGSLHGHCIKVPGKKPRNKVAQSGNTLIQIISHEMHVNFLRLHAKQLSFVKDIFPRFSMYITGTNIPITRDQSVSSALYLNYSLFNDATCNSRLRGTCKGVPLKAMKAYGTVEVELHSFITRH